MKGVNPVPHSSREDDGKRTIPPYAARTASSCTPVTASYHRASLPRLSVDPAVFLSLPPSQPSGKAPNPVSQEQGDSSIPPAAHTPRPPSRTPGKHLGEEGRCPFPPSEASTPLSVVASCIIRAVFTSRHAFRQPQGPPAASVIIIIIFYNTTI